MIRREVKSLCDACRWVQYLQFSSQNEPMRHCSFLSRRMPDTVVECSLRVAPGELTLNEMHNAAWLIDMPDDGKIGFLRPGTVEHQKAAGFVNTPIRGPR